MSRTAYTEADRILIALIGLHDADHPAGHALGACVLCDAADELLCEVTDCDHPADPCPCGAAHCAAHPHTTTEED